MMMSPPYSSGDGLPATRRKREENTGESRARTGASPFMYAGMYTCNVCMECLTCDPCNSVGVFAHLYMAGKASS